MVRHDDLGQPDLSETKARLYLDGIWSASEFSLLTATMARMYERLNAFLPISAAFDNYIQRCSYESPYFIQDRPDFRTAVAAVQNWSESYDDIIRAAARRKSQLVVNEVHFGSPGFLEFIGNLNPLKVTLDFISAYRHENTLREEQKLRWETERMRIRSEVVRDVLERADTIRQNGHSGYLERFIEYTLDQTMRDAEELSKDSRLDGVELVPLG